MALDRSLSRSEPRSLHPQMGTVFLVLGYLFPKGSCDGKDLGFGAITAGLQISAITSLCDL